MTFVRSNLLGWGFAETLTSAQMNSVDIDKSRAVDGFAAGTYTPSAELIWRGPIVIDASAGFGTNEWGLQVTSKGIASGIIVNAGAASADGIQATGGANAIGVFGQGGAGAAVGVWGQGSGASNGILGTGGPTDGTAIRGIANGAATDAIGVQGEGKGSLPGVKGIGGAGAGVYGTTTAAGPGVRGESTTGYGVTAQGDTTPAGASKAAILISPQSQEPGSLDDGAIWIRSDAGFIINAYLGGAVREVLSDHHDLAPKAWGNITTDGAGGFTTNNTFGCTATIAGSAVRVTLANNHTDANWCFTGTCFGTDRFLVIDNMTNALVDVVGYDHSGGALDMASDTVAFCFAIMGEL